ncbi:SWIB-domain-containing protein [Dichomitus squalens]|uniref:SWIB-domain-containing protein n=2 Tax=Dichomitus squalens TaxID=114155 RepID=A0A4Q9PYA4_9APHY|nr:SWIB-domain-containing protein [Dichomitus squalens LYAD-421 SS1]EJF57568.1 SWIB-domain-containing protein [Dichomitus squalens LYAD-421 SS1]TBU39519.1 SWIB-domain-containing protein [Dichomitus squalens]TBU59615.1 SWIB-domain-containing protein [Dichomitus squalens]
MSSQLHGLEPRIRAILTAPGTDLATISAKRVRKQLVQDDPSLSHFVKEQKDEIEDLIAQVYEQICEDGNGDDDEVESSTVSKRKREDASDDERTAAPKKTKKTKTKQQKTDEEIARQLQSEINGRGRSSRAGASSTKKANGTKRGKKKSADTVGSDGEEAEGEGKKKRGGGGFKKEYMLSEPLAALLSVDKLSRPQTVKQLWTYIKANNMQNPENKKEIICDDRFRAIFKCDRIDMFKMNKELGQHLYEPPAVAE